MPENRKKEIFDITLRYILVIATIFILPLFYIIFKPLTLWFTYFILHFFYNVQVSGANLVFSNATIEIIDACVAGSAFFLLLVLNLVTREIKIAKRIYLFLFQALILLLLNVLRLVILIPMFLQNSASFDITHKLFWYVLSTIFVVLIWLFGAWLFKIKTIPAYSDVIFLLRSKSK
jgi:exosortase/archaeosortase family protein